MTKLPFRSAWQKRRGVLVRTRTPLLLQGGGGSLVRFGLRLEFVFFVINVLRRRFLFMVDLLLFRSRQRSAVGLAVRGHLPVNALLLLLGLGRFASRHLPALDALGDAVLLIFAALVHFVVGIVLGARVVLVLADLLGKLILLPVDLFFLCRRQLATIGRAVRFGLGIEGRFFGFELRSFTSRHVAALHPLGDAILLIFFAPRHGGLGSCCRRGCGRWCCCRSALGFVGLLRTGQRHGSGHQHQNGQGTPLHAGKFHGLSPKLSEFASPGSPCNTRCCSESWAAATGLQYRFCGSPRCFP